MSCLLLFLLAALGLAAADVFEECDESNRNNFIASNKSCTHFIYCSGEDSFEGECPEENDYFNAHLAMCEPMEEVDCRTGLPLQTNEVQQITVTELPVVTVTVTQTVTTASTALDVSSETVTAAAPAATAPSSASSQQVVTLVASECPPTDNTHQIVLLAHDKSCTEYFICYHGKPLPMTCATMLHFNVHTAKCDKAEVVNCMRSTISVREQCKQHTVDIYPHPDNCNYFYYCRNGFLMLQQCPFFYGWDYEKRSCVAIAQAKCFGRQSLLI
ncbi:uncharacterized protein LOC6582029 [Drosophila mojavensis]|uniref:Chitin-binding type-2 domain-containing protein n=1 Tax=Drosophila mojavensis TaxID=7230 RepID=B4KUJ0_DROMO|nr:uncharacterized protein LOC6582029 [Drosophila mojavensis]EDW18218.1 uncharacterized protein Dmoj_GI12219 [Drosophila mojavensis]